MRVEDKIKEMLPIPTYYKTDIDPSVDLNSIVGSIPCKFHNEKHGASFSYSKEKKVCSCFGRCHFTEDVIGLHQRWHKLESREEAIDSLCNRLGIEKGRIGLVRAKDEIKFYEVEKTSLLNKCERLAKDIETILELDYLMSQLKSDSELIEDLKQFVERHGGRLR